MAGFVTSGQELPSRVILKQGEIHFQGENLHLALKLYLNTHKLVYSRIGHSRDLKQGFLLRRGYFEHRSGLKDTSYA